jgi:serine/threonine protein kinase
MAVVNFIGQTLDDKYQIERELGKGGMGTVYLATHVGTGRPVALKIIAPQFMEKLEFVERFRREARAAGKLRHPNVVNVTDFGFAQTASGNVAYLVMEYLDGVTLGEVLEEEKRLPVAWTIDILEQVCSAVQEAHEQGIIHRDLKPDNIWLEPNQRGGYTVKVLDFGIAKLEESSKTEAGRAALKSSSTTPTRVRQTTTVADQTQPNTIIENRSSTLVSEGATVIQTAEVSDLDTEAGTLIQPVEILEDKTAILSAAENKTAILPVAAEHQTAANDQNGTKLMSEQFDTDKSPTNSPNTSELTRVGAVLGTPLYMSPEQCRGDRLNPSSDIYSLGVIAYQMLSGATPFTGDFKSVMDSHKDVEPPPLQTKKVPKRLKQTIMDSLSKETEKRPQTAESLASKLRANSEGLGELFRRALVIYSQHLPKFLLLAIVTGLPYILLTVLKVSYKSLEIVKVIDGEGAASMAVSSFFGLTTFFVQIFYAAFLLGMTTWIVAQILAVPLRPINLRAASDKAKSHWKPLMGTVTFSTLLSMIAWGVGFFVGGLIGLAFGVPLYFFVSQILAFIVGILICLAVGLVFGVYISGLLMLVAPSIMMEDLRGRKAFRRSINLFKRSPLTVFNASLVVYLIPIILAFTIAFSVSAIVKAVISEVNKPSENITAKSDNDFTVNFGAQKANVTTSESKDDSKDQASNEMKAKLKGLAPAISALLIEILTLPLIIVLSSFTSVVTALLYFKTRQAGGETMRDLLESFEETETAPSRWQERVRERLVQSGRITGSKKLSTG